MKLVHYGSEPLGLLLPVIPAAQDCGSRMKPKGLWVSVDSCKDNWRTWCEGEQFHLEKLTCAQEIIVKKEANILRLKSSYHLDDFTWSYPCIEKPYAPLKDGGPELDYYRINWSRVAYEYDGIIIAPYIWERRRSLMWYYGWDCASGCIWNTEAIAEICAPQISGMTAT